MDGKYACALFLRGRANREKKKETKLGLTVSHDVGGALRVENVADVSCLYVPRHQNQENMEVGGGGGMMHLT